MHFEWLSKKNWRRSWKLGGRIDTNHTMEFLGLTGILWRILEIKVVLLSLRLQWKPLVNIWVKNSQRIIIIIERAEKKKPTITWDHKKRTPSNKWRKRKTKIKKTMRKLLETNIYSNNLIKGINTWTVLVRYPGPFLLWIREELKEMNQRTRKVMTMHKNEHPRDDVDRLYI